MSVSAILTFPNFYGKLETFPSCCVQCFYKYYKPKELSLSLNGHENNNDIKTENKSKLSSLIGASISNRMDSDILGDNNNKIPEEDELTEGEEEEKAR
eukprot:91353_1